MGIEWTEDAIEGLDQIYDWNAYHFSLSYADDILDGIHARAEMLLTVPFSGRVDPYFEHLGFGHRYVIRPKYWRLVYLVKGDKIWITNVFDMRMNPDQYFRSGG